MKVIDKEKQRMKEYHLANRERRLAAMKKRGAEKRAENSAKINEYNRNYYWANHDKQRRQKKVTERTNNLMKSYGISEKEWDQLFEAQGQCCAVCKTKEPGWYRGWHTDHCHETKIVRGILCHKCNMGIGLFRDNATIMQTAISYLQRGNLINSS